MWFSFLIYTVLTALLPGPNNILALNSTMTIGYKRSRSLLIGIYSGFTLIMLLSAILSNVAVHYFANLLEYLKYFGAIYLLFLAWSVIKSKSVDIENSKIDSREDSYKSDFWKGFFLQLINVKIIIYGITAFSSFVFPHFNDIKITLIFVVFLALVGNGATWIWALAGEKLAHFLNKYSTIVNLVMALLLVYCAVSLFL